MRKIFQTWWKLPVSVWVWVGKNESQIVAVATIVMIWTLIQNQKSLKQNAQTLQASVESWELQRISTLHPELECAYSTGQGFTNYGFVLRNVGNAAATNIYLRVSAVCVTSNSVYALEYYRVPVGTGVSPLREKLQLAPSEKDQVQDLYVPNMDWLEEVMLKYQGDILVRLYVEYERPNPSYRRYSGCFNFVYSRNWFPGYLQTPEESPRVQQALERFNSIPPSQRHAIWSPIHKTDVWEVMDSVSYGRSISGMEADNRIGPMKPLNWTKHN